MAEKRKIGKAARKQKPNYTKLLRKTALSFLSLSPMIIAILGLVGLMQSFISKEMLASLFTGNPLYDTAIGTFTGAIAVGQALISYIIGGELLEQGISMYAVTALLLSWVTLGFVQLPLEAEVLGKRFTIYRNLLALAGTVLVSLATVATLELIR